MTSTLEQTPLHAWHANHGARLVDFAGWSMPVQYKSIVAEHEATRASAGLFDISHMGRLRFSGAGSRAFLDELVTRRVSDTKPGQVRYSLVTNELGGILDDVLVYDLHAPAGSGEDRGGLGSEMPPAEMPSDVTVPSRKFIRGEPMKPATNSLSGSS